MVNKMDEKQRESIVSFFKQVDDLKEKQVIRSDKYLGDIAEFLCKELYDLQLAESGRQAYYDATDRARNKVQIKSHFSSKRTNMQNISFDDFDYLLLLIGPNSFIKPKNTPEDMYLIYKIVDSVTKNIHKVYLSRLNYDKCLDKNFDIIDCDSAS